MPAFQLCEPSHHVSVTAVRSWRCDCTGISNSCCLLMFITHPSWAHFRAAPFLGRRIFLLRSVGISLFATCVSSLLAFHCLASSSLPPCFRVSKSAIGSSLQRLFSRLNKPNSCSVFTNIWAPFLWPLWTHAAGLPRVCQHLPFHGWLTMGFSIEMQQHRCQVEQNHYSPQSAGYPLISEAHTEIHCWKYTC